MKAVAWPWNQPGWKATAPPVVGQYVLFVVVPIPPPGFCVSQATFSTPILNLQDIKVAKTYQAQTTAGLDMAMQTSGQGKLTRIHPLHAIRESLVCNEGIPS